MKLNYVLIDYENVQSAAIDVLDKADFRVIVFVGASQTRIALEVAAALQTMGQRAEYVRISGNGPNALDFHIAFYIGQLTRSTNRRPNASMHLRDRGARYHKAAGAVKSLRTKNSAVSPATGPRGSYSARSSPHHWNPIRR